jgi:AcrR family transcriptional regulator
MVRPVKRVRYDNSGRQAGVRATKRRVTDAAHRLFTGQGWAATTIGTISDASGVPAPTIYRLFGTKMAILSAVLDVAFAGDDEPLAFHERPAVLDAFAEPDPRRLLAAFARLARELLERSGRLQHVLSSAAEADPDAAELLERTRRQRHLGQSRVARALAERDDLRDDTTENEAADTIYALMSPELHRILTAERGWSPDRYERWLASALGATLLPAGP